MEENQLTVILEAIENIPQRKPSYRSDNINELCAALAQAQQEMSLAPNNKKNPINCANYADLAAVINASRYELSKNGLCVMQNILENDSGQTILHTILAHSSGQWIESRIRIIPTKNDIQSLGDAITYNRRYAYAALIGIAQYDDDGNAQMEEIREQDKKEGYTRSAPRKGDSHDVINSVQLKELRRELEEYPSITEDLLTKMHLRTLADLPANQYDSVIVRIRKLKIEMDSN